MLKVKYIIGGKLGGRMKKILIIAPFTTLKNEKGFDRFRYIAENLADRGHDVTLVTSNFVHSTKCFRNKDIILKEKYKIQLIEEKGYQKNVSLERIYSHGVFNKNLKEYLYNLDDKAEVVYCAYPLMGAARIANKYSKINNIKFILDIQDIWPESIKCVYDVPYFMLYPLSKRANKLYRDLEYIVAVSNTYLERATKVNRNYKRAKMVPIGVDLAYFNKCNKNVIKKKDEFWVTYIGTLSYSYDIKTLIRAQKILQSKGYENIKLKILGIGPDKKKLENLSNKIQSNAEFLGLLEYEEMASILKKSDLALNAISSTSLGSLTNKLGDYLSARLPILNSCENEEVKVLIKNYRLGSNYVAGDYKKLACIIEEYYNKKELCNEASFNSYKIAKNMFDRNNTYTDIYNIIEGEEYEI